MTERKSGAPSAQCEESGNINTSKAIVTLDAVLEELEQSGRKFRKSTKGHHALLRDSLQTAQRIIVKFLDNEALQKQFVKKEKKKGRKEAFNWSLEIVAKATGASSRAARKLASKRAGVLEFLRYRKVPVKNTAATLKKEGVEKLYSEWCKKKKETETPATRDGKFMLALWMDRADLDRVLKQKVGTKLTVLVSRVSESDGNLKVKGVMVVNGLVEEADEADDWED